MARLTFQFFGFMLIVSLGLAGAFVTGPAQTALLLAATATTVAVVATTLFDHFVESK